MAGEAGRLGGHGSAEESVLHLRLGQGPEGEELGRLSLRHGARLPGLRCSHVRVRRWIHAPPIVVQPGMSGWTTYDEYGNATRLSASTVGNMCRWHGADQRAVLAAGLILMGVRLYNPVTGHFTTRDPVPGGNSTMYAYPQDPLNSDDLDGLAALYGGLYILYIGRTAVYIRQSVNIRSRVLKHFRKPHFLRVPHVAVKSIPQHRGESHKSYKRRISVAEQRVMNNLRARGV